MQVWVRAEEGEFGVMLVNFEESIVLRVEMSRKQCSWGSEESMGWGQRFDGAQLTGWNRNLSALLSSQAPCSFHSLLSHSPVFLCLCLFSPSPHPPPNQVTPFLFIRFPLWPAVALGTAFLPKFKPMICRGLATRRLQAHPPPPRVAINPQCSLIFICYLPTWLCPFYLFFCLGRAQVWFFAGRVCLITFA